MRFRKKPLIILGLIIATNSLLVYEKNNILKIFYKKEKEIHQNLIKNFKTEEDNNKNQNTENEISQENNTTVKKESFDIKGCEKDFLEGTPPNLPYYLLTKSQFICYHHYGVLASGLTKTGLISAEYLTKNDVDQARTLKRHDAFHQDPYLNPDWGTNENSYKRKKYDRGHLTPSGDEPTQEDQYESFSMANMAPQNPKLNRGKWEHIEATVRNTADDDGTYIITGTLANSEDPKLQGTDIVIPNIYYKAIFEPSKNYCGIWVAKNVENGEIIETSFEKFNNVFQIDLFPTLKNTDCYKNHNLPSTQ